MIWKDQEKEKLIWLKIKYSGTPPYNHLVITAAFLCPKQIESPVMNFSISKTSLIRPPCYYDHIFMARRWSYQQDSTVTLC